MPCIICKKNFFRNISFGLFGISHNYNSNSKKYNLIQKICKNCNLVTLKNKVPVSKLVPKYSWIDYNEPEEHLDYLVKLITSLDGINNKSVIAGVSYKEKTTLERLRKKKFKNTWILNPKKDLKIKNPKANLETIQQHMNLRILKKIKLKKLKPDIIIARHIIEHSYNIKNFSLFLKKIINPDGYIILEIPDCEDSFKSIDYTTLWEEHVYYFTLATFKNILINLGFEIKFLKKYKYPFENVIIAIVKLNTKKKKNNLKFNTKKKRINFTEYQLQKDRKKIKKLILNLKQKGFKIIIFGTGHVSNIFINSLKITNLVDYAIDDNLNKKNFTMPNSKIKIYNKNKIFEEEKFYCILALNSSSEKKVLNYFKNIKDINKKFVSMYSKSKLRIKEIYG